MSTATSSMSLPERFRQARNTTQSQPALMPVAENDPIMQLTSEHSAHALGSESPLNPLNAFIRGLDQFDIGRTAIIVNPHLGNFDGPRFHAFRYGQFIAKDGKKWANVIEPPVLRAVKITGATYRRWGKYDGGRQLEILCRALDTDESIPLQMRWTPGPHIAIDLMALGYSLAIAGVRVPLEDLIDQVRDDLAPIMLVTTKRRERDAKGYVPGPESEMIFWSFEPMP